MRRRHRHNRINPFADNHRGTLRRVGLALTITGGIFLIIGLGSFFGSMDSFDQPRHFWCVFVGMPLLGIGVSLLKFGYMGAMARYVAGEAAPVASDAVNYVIDETSGSVQKVASAVRRGLANQPQPADTVRCAGCGTDNNPSARFCNQCGETMPTAVACKACHKDNDDDARFCSHCGAAIG